MIKDEVIAMNKADNTFDVCPFELTTLGKAELTAKKEDLSGRERQFLLLIDKHDETCQKACSIIAAKVDCNKLMKLGLLKATDGMVARSDDDITKHHTTDKKITIAHITGKSTISKPVKPTQNKPLTTAPPTQQSPSQHLEDEGNEEFVDISIFVDLQETEDS